MGRRSEHEELRPLRCELCGHFARGDLDETNSHERDWISREGARLRVTVSIEIGIVGAVSCTRRSSSPMTRGAFARVGAAPQSFLETRDRWKVPAAKAVVTRELQMKELRAELVKLSVRPESRADLALWDVGGAERTPRLHRIEK